MTQSDGKFSDGDFKKGKPSLCGVTEWIACSLVKIKPGLPYPAGMSDVRKASLLYTWLYSVQCTSLLVEKEGQYQMWDLGSPHTGKQECR